MLKVEHLSKSYKDLKAVDDLSLEVKKGEIFALLGPNGAGKTTTIECILNIKTMDEGKVLIDGQPLGKMLSQIGVQFQTSYFPDRIKVYEMCQMISVLYKDSLDYNQLLKRFGLLEKRQSLVSNLSGGQKQKLSVLLALLNQPQIVFLDELTTGLDPEARREVWAILKDLSRQGMTIFLTSHYMDEVAYLCDRLLILKEGRCILSGTPDKVIEETGKENLEEAYLKIMEEVS